MENDINQKNLNHFGSCDEGAVFLGKEISKTIDLLKRDPLLFFVSGGSALNVLPNIENDNFENVTVAVLDERYDASNESNNFCQLKKIPWSKFFLQEGGVLISTEVLEGDTQQQLADRYRTSIEKWLDDSPTGKMIALFGMGSDGHTAGIFPYPKNPEIFQKMFNGNELVSSYDASGKNQFAQRITTTNALFKKLEGGFLYACGQEKKKALHDFVEGTKKENELPVMFLKNIKKLKIVTDIE